MKKKNHSEKGQVLILLTLSVVGLLGFTALAIDGGRIYADRRYAQNGADAASLAGAGAAASHIKEVWDNWDSASGDPEPNVTSDNWSCGGDVATAMQLAVDQAIANAFQNGFAITYSSNFNADGNIVAVYCDPTGHFIDVRVSITFDTQTSFLHFVYQGPAQNTVEAITRVYPPEPLAAGYSIVSLTDNCSGNEKGTRFSGTGEVYINDGGVFSNSCIVSDGSSGTVQITNGSAAYDENFPYDPHGQPIISPSPTPTSTVFKPTFDFPSGCLGYDDPSPDVSGDDYVYKPGRYTSDIHITGNGSVTPTVTLKPGLYCFDDGAGFMVNGSDISVEDAGTGGAGVTFYFTNDGGGFDTLGNGNVEIYPPVKKCKTPPYPSTPPYSEDCYPAVANLLIYIEQGNTSPVKLGGNSASYYEGTVYSESGQVRIGGTSEGLSDVGVQVIADSVRVYGNTTLTIKYDKSKILYLPPYINLQH
jgi:hypothetical protein